MGFTMDFCCPKCGGELALVSEKVKKCPLGHSYDRAKEGYFNLLLSVGGGNHGDNAEMVRARREFLSYGYYEPLARRLSELVLKYTERCGAVLDAGFGEGYYTDIVERALYERDGDSLVLGFDISKDAVRYAAKRNPRITSAVASSYDIPIKDGTVNTVINVFSPLATEQMKRVLSDGGYFVMVYPAERHLFGLKEKIYDNPYLNEPKDTSIDGFEIVFSEKLAYNFTVTGSEHVRALFMMTPYAYRTGKDGRERVLSLAEVECEAEFLIDVYRKV